ncbi:C40 family peptidase [Kineococcus sp. SYSU DK003]|uniref:C40 family peptidase n=1 Tax=Kineococcus sp. SYSU DK003 TaxID=3383124 RepID=UPI003D7E8628
MTTRVQARHRAAVRSLTSLTDLSNSVTRCAGGAARTGAVVAAAGGLLVSIALPAGAATAAAPAAVSSTVSSAVAAVPAAFGTTAVGVVSAPATATTLATTSTFAAAPAPAPVVVAPVVTRVARTADANAVVAASVAENAAAVPAPVAVQVAAEAPAPAPAPAPVASLGSQILAVADDYAGVPYVYGGTTPSGFDCSGYTSYVYRQVGVEIPRTSNAQLQSSARISRGEAVPGDLVFFTNSGGRAYHVGIYAGDNMMWDAPRAGKPVQLRAIWSDAVTFGRLAPTV